MTAPPTAGSPTSGKERAGYLPTLDGWRAVAVALVIVSHTVPEGGHRAWWQRDRIGHLGVALFFGISGLLICTRLVEELHARARIRLGSFYVRRCFRIVPAAWLYLAVLGLTNVEWVLAVDPSEFAASALFYRNYVSGVWYTGHFWSLAVEEHFYLFFPLFLALAGPRQLCWVLPAFALAIAAWRGIDTATGAFDSVLRGTYGPHRTDRCLDGILWGCWAAVILHASRRPSRWLSPPVGAALVAAVPACFFALHSLTWTAFLIPWAVAATVVRPNAPLSRLLEWAPLRWVGRLSYSLYLWQQLFFVMHRSNRVYSLLGAQTWPWNLLLLLTCAVASYYLVERPLIRLGHHLARPVSPGRGDLPAAG